MLAAWVRMSLMISLSVCLSVSLARSLARSSTHPSSPPHTHQHTHTGALLKVLFEAPPKDEPTIIFCNTLGSVRALEGWLSAVPEAQEMAGGAEGKICALHSRIPREVSMRERW